MFRVVVDSNIYVSAVVFGGTPSAVLQLADTGAFEVVVSSAIQAEVEETLERKFGYDPGLIAGIAAELWTKAHRVNPKHAVKASRDPDDDHILACALEARADMIVTGDRDLLALHPFGEIEILPPADLLRRLVPEINR